jgi:hypothetical protein
MNHGDVYRSPPTAVVISLHRFLSDGLEAENALELEVGTNAPHRLLGWRPGWGRRRLEAVSRGPLHDKNARSNVLGGIVARGLE